MKEKSEIEREEMEVLHKRAIQNITDELNQFRDASEKKLAETSDAHAKAVFELQGIIKEILAARAAESNFAKAEADRLGKEFAQLMKENTECFNMLQNLVPLSELESARWDVSR